MNQINRFPLIADTSTLDVIIPNYNQGHLLKNAVESILQQSIRPTKVIIVDDASIDSSREIIQELQKKYGFIKAFFLAENIGSIKASKFGFENSTSDYVQFASAKDLIAENSFKKLIPALDANRNAAFACGLVRVTFNGVDTGILKPTILPVFRSGYLSGNQVQRCLRQSDNWMLTVGAVFRRKSISDFDFPDERFGALADGYFARKLGATFGFVFIPEIVYSWNQMSSSQSKILSETSEKTFRILDLIYSEILQSDVFFKGYAIKFVDRSVFSILLDRINRKIPTSDEFLLDFYKDKNKSKIWLKSLQSISSTALPKCFMLAVLFVLLKPASYSSVFYSYVFRRIAFRKFKQG